MLKVRSFNHRTQVMKRTRIPQRKSERLFTRTAQKVHPKNTMMPMRGGIRA